MMATPSDLASDIHASYPLVDVGINLVDSAFNKVC